MEDRIVLLEADDSRERTCLGSDPNKDIVSSWLLGCVSFDEM